MIRSFTLASMLMLFLSGCDKAEPVTYKIPKEDRIETVNRPTTETPQMPPKSNASGMQVLPGMEEAAQSAPELTYTVPETWEEFPPQSIRKANFRVSDENGSAEMTVTVFPGDVGGKLGNINRWRTQIGLDAIDEKGMAELTRPYVISNHSGTLVDLQGAEQSILGGMLGFHGSTWFFKMQGSTGTVAAQADAMEAFLDSVQIEDEHH